MTSRSNVHSLSERLENKISADRSEIEALTKRELERLASSSREHAQSVLVTTHKDMAKQLQGFSTKLNQQLESLNSQVTELQREFKKLKTATLKAWMRPVIIGMSLFLGISLGSLVLTHLLTFRVADQMKKLEDGNELLRRIEKDVERANTWGVKYAEDKNGRFLIFPKNTAIETQWDCPSGPCVRLGRR